MQAHVGSGGEDRLAGGRGAVAAPVLRAVIFSLDMEWLDRQSPVHSRVERQIHRQSAKFGVPAAKRYVARLVELGEGEVDRADFYERVEAELELAPGEARRLIEGGKRNTSEQTQPLAEIRACMDGLRHLGLKIGLVVNGPEAAAPRLRQLGVLAHVDEVVFSEGEPGLGPDPSLFARCLIALDESPRASVYVGSRSQTDLLGANQAGLTAVWRRDGSESDPSAADILIDDLGELEVWARARVAPRVRAH